MFDTLQALITTVLARAPHWIRQDLSSSDASVRTRAEETLAAMIDQAIRESAGA